MVIRVHKRLVFFCRCTRIRAWISNGLVHRCGPQRTSTSRWYIGLATATTSHTCVNTAVATGRTITNIPCVVTSSRHISMWTGMPRIFKPRYDSNIIIKFADDTTVICLISDDDESAHSDDVKHLVRWCASNDLVLNVSKTK